MEMNDLVLGLDLGVASIGWALVDMENRCIADAGVRVFDAPMDMVKFEAGKPGGSNAVQRRKSIHQGRRLARKKGRHRDLYIALQTAGLLPFAGNRAERRHDVLTQLDKEWGSKRWGGKWRDRIRSEAPEIADPGQILCYYLRASALTAPLEPHELGRALYHLGQRRGFKSNRRESRSTLNAEDEKKEEVERSKIKRSIGTLDDHLQKSGQTLGQYLAFVNPHTSALRNRKRADIAAIWTGRGMFEEEFEKIWSAQQAYHASVLTPALKGRLSKLMFRQRKVSGGKPGSCELEREPPRPRAPRSSLLAQHFRLVQTLNNLKVRESIFAEYRKLTRAERDKLLAELSTLISKMKGKKSAELFGLRFTEVKERLGLRKTAKLNLDDDEESSYLRGNRTNAIMSRAFGAERWRDLPEAEKRRIVRKWMNETRPENLLEVAKTRWALGEKEARQLASLEAEDGYLSLSHVAMLRLLKHMDPDEGNFYTYAEAVAKEYGDVLSHGTELDYLPPAEKALPQIPNPVVKRTLSELRKVVNAIIRENRSKPKQIRIELARDLKRNAEQRARLQEDQKRNKEKRAEAKAMLASIGIRPTEDALLKASLYRRCTRCLYCTEYLGSPEEIFKDTSGIQVEHVLPKRIHDDSFSNKVLAHHSCNIRKADRTPIQAFGENPEWGEMLNLVTSLKDESLLKKFKISDESEMQQFSSQALSDTRYISKLATQYVEQLYGGRDASVPWEDRNRRCVYVSSGILTAKLRKRWGLNAVLKDTYGNGSNNEKVRTDHRHHAVDAIVIALTTESMVQQASLDAQRLEKAPGYLEPRYFRPPWPRVGDVEDQVKAFRGEIQEAIDKITVSHRVDHKLKGKLHEDTYYSPKVDGQRFVYLRVPVFELKAEDIDDPNNKIDSYIRTALRKHHLHLGGEMKKGADLKKFEKNPAYIEKHGRKIFIRKVLKAVPASSVERLERREGQPSIKLGENHHFVIFERTSEDGKPMWYTPGPVSRFEVMKKKDRVKREGISQPYPLIETKDGPGSTYKMFLMKGDAVRMRDPVNDLDDTYIFASSSEGDYAFLRHSTSVPSPKSLGLTQGAMRQQMQARGDRIRIRNIDKLRELKCRKIMLDPLGRFSNRSE